LAVYNNELLILYSGGLKIFKKNKTFKYFNNLFTENSERYTSLKVSNENVYLIKNDRLVHLTRKDKLKMIETTGLLVNEIISTPNNGVYLKGVSQQLFYYDQKIEKIIPTMYRDVIGTASTFLEVKNKGAETKILALTNSGLLLLPIDYTPFYNSNTFDSRKSKVQTAVISTKGKRND
jgi:hypothetical protein